MPIIVREFLGDHAVQSPVSITSGLKSINVKENFSTHTSMKEGSILQIIESIHEGMTRNLNYYTNEALFDSVDSWTEPYEKPLILHHNEENGEIVGRVIHCEYQKEGTRSGTPAQIHTCHIPDPEVAKQIEDGRLKTVSIGVIIHEAKCSVCGEDIELDEDGDAICGHLKGQVYDEDGEQKLAYWIINKMEAKELSYVVVPSDPFAHNLKTIKPTRDSIKKLGKESLSKFIGGLNIMEKQTNTSINQTEATVITEEVNATNMSTISTEPVPVSQGVNVEDQKTEEPKITEPENKECDCEKSTEIENLKKEIVKLKNIIADGVIAAEDLKASLSQETAQREASEEELLSAKTELRESLEGSFNIHRKLVGKSVIESLSDRSISSLRDSISDMKADLSKAKPVSKASVTEAVDPTLKVEDDKKEQKISKVNVKESKTISNTKVDEAFNSVFNF